MKKALLPFVLLCGLVVTSLGQTPFYDGFTGTDNIGGTGNLTNNNGWTTHSPSTGGGTIPITSGSLSYAGLQASTGNKVSLPGSNTTTSRDVNATLSLGTGVTVAYFSGLINVTDNTQLATAFSDNSYFMHFGNTTGTSVTTLYARLHIKSVNSGANFRLGIQNISGTGASQTEYATDLNFGTTYLVVVKYDFNGTSNDIATLWINPSSLGGSEPAGSVSNSGSSSTSATTFASVCIRNSTATPKVDIDEVRAGLAWADVTPTGGASAPTWTSGWPKAENATSTGFTAKVNINVPGTSYFVVLASGATAPSSAQVKAGQDAGGNPLASNLKGTIPCASGNTEYTSPVTGLSNSTTYDVYFVAEDASLNLQAAPVKVSVTTQASATAPSISSPTFASITNNSALLGGDVTSDGGSTITARGVVWSQTSLNSDPLLGGANVTDVPGTGTTGVFTVTAGSLPAEANISFKAYATNAIGTSYTTVTTFYTLADEPSSHVGDFTATASSQTQIDLTWTTATGADGYIILIRQGAAAPTGTPADATGYSVGNTIGNGTVTAIVTPGSATSQPVTGLTASTQYYFTIMPFAWDGTNYQTYNYNTTPTIPSATTFTQSPPASSYTWTGDTDFDWTVESNWDPVRSSPANNDILIFDNGYTITVTSVPTQTIGQLHVTNGTKLTLEASAAVTLTFFGDSGTDLEVASGCELNVSNTYALIMALSAQATGSISGNMTFTSAAHKLIGQAASAITFNNGAIFTSGTGFSSNAFGSSSSTPAAVANSVIFSDGSTYLFVAGSNPFALTAPASVVVFQTGSLYKQTSSSTPSFSGRTYANFEMDATGQTVSTTGGSAVIMDNLTITNGTLNFNMTATPGHTIKGNITIAGGAALNFNPASAGTVILGGSAAQTISGTGTLTFSTNSTIKVNNAAGIVLSRDVALNNLEFQAGNITTGAYILSTATAPTGGGGGGYVNGNLQIAVPLTATTLNFAIGDASNYTPVSIDYTGITLAGSMTAYTTVGIHPEALTSGINNAKCVSRYWTITNSSTEFTSCDATFTFVPGDILGGGDPDLFIVMKWDPSSWSETNIGARTATSTKITDITSFSDFMIGEPEGVVPRMLAVSGTVEAGYANCYNATDTITVGGDGTPFEILENGAATMKAGIAIIYLPGTWVHPGGYMLGKIFPGGPYCSGKAPEKSLALVESSVNLIDNSFRIYPNPTTGLFTIEQRGDISADPVRVDVLSAIGGKILSTEFRGVPRQDLSIKGNPAGIYFVKVTAGSRMQTVKIILTN